MKKFVAIFLTVSILGGATHLDELGKLPFLIHHYNEHKALHTNDSFSTFLYKHYVLNQEAESATDEKSDSQLPFKSTQCFQTHFNSFVCESKTIQLLPEEVQTVFVPTDETKIVLRSFDIWQPPRLS